MDTWTCSVCYREHIPAKQRYKVLRCGHEYCTKCLAELVWRQQSHRCPTCPMCRQPMLHCGPSSHGLEAPANSSATASWTAANSLGASGSATHGPSGQLAPACDILPLQIGRVRFELRVERTLNGAEESVRSTICKLFQLDPNRLKLVSRSRCLETEEQLRAAAASRSVVALIASRRNPAITGPIQWILRLLLLPLRSVWQRMVSLLRWLAATRIVVRLCAALRPMASAMRLFAASLNPAFVAPPVSTKNSTADAVRNSGAVSSTTQMQLRQ
ncbi:hypothetical protein Vretimale_18801 [Volvox reticuliferus]|uniref:RING-type domain-containing protein n=1 Tax=Volvox reticuliferus TaxID=1737510 RepID=A0A8J4GXZ7_9CHLO|nr:hypothetical protein Vretimale_18801 [Volvox reticuliferus]